MQFCVYFPCFWRWRVSVLLRVKRRVLIFEAVLRLPWVPAPPLCPGARRPLAPRACPVARTKWRKEGPTPDSTPGLGTHPGRDPAGPEPVGSRADRWTGFGGLQRVARVGGLRFLALLRDSTPGLRTHPSSGPSGPEPVEARAHRWTGLGGLQRVAGLGRVRFLALVTDSPP